MSVILMLFEIILSCKTLVTCGAHKFLVCDGVNLLMVLKVSVGCETGPTSIANVRSFTNVGLCMLFKVVQTFKALGTYFTGEMSFI